MQYGCGTHPDPRVAARRAITEAAQSRVTAIQGAREDLEAGAVAESDPPPEWFDPAAGIDFAELGGFENRDLLADVELMVERLLEAGLDEVVAVDLTNPALEFPVVKMIVPGLELAFHAVDPARVPFGWRARRVFEPSWAEEVIAAAH